MTAHIIIGCSFILALSSGYTKEKSGTYIIPEQLREYSFFRLLKLKVTSPVIGAPMQKRETRILKQEPVIIPEQISFLQPVLQQESANPLNLLVFLYILGAAIQLSLILFALVRIRLLIRKSTKLQYSRMKLLLGPDGIVPFINGYW